MSRDDERDSVIQFREDSAEMTVPGVTMHQIGVDVRGVEIDIAAKRPEDRLQRLRTSEAVGVEIEPRDFEPALFEILIAEAANIDIDRLRQLAREITNVHTGAAVNVRRIFVGEEEDFHCMFLLIAARGRSKVDRALRRAMLQMAPQAR